MISMFFKGLFLGLAMMGLCMCLTHWFPSLWNSGFTIPKIDLRMTYAATILVLIGGLGLTKLSFG